MMVGSLVEIIGRFVVSFVGIGWAMVVVWIGCFRTGWARIVAVRFRVGWNIIVAVRVRVGCTWIVTVRVLV